jgi:putative SOS response-associated peptidase YedK
MSWFDDTMLPQGVASDSHWKLVGAIHDRMPAVLHPENYERWLGLEPDPRDALQAA